MDTIVRNPLTFVSANNAPTGFPTQVEAIALGTPIEEYTTGRRYRFVKFNLSGVSCKLGTPVAFVSSFGVVTPDISDAKDASAYSKAASRVFAGIALASHAPTSGSTTYGWIMTQGPLGKLLNSKIPDVTVKTFISTTLSVKQGKVYGLRSTQDGFLAHFSSAISDSRAEANMVYFGASISAARKSVASGWIYSIW